ncbi:MAG: ABC transporter ATP-binding protein, partial [Clostridia bacterium]
VQAMCTHVAAHRTVRDLRTDLFAHLSRVPISYIDTHAHGDLIQRVVNDVDAVSQGLLQGITQLFTGVVSIVGTLAFMIWVQWRIALAVAVLTPLSLCVAAFIAKHTHLFFGAQSHIQGKLGGYIEEMIGNQRVVKAFGHEAQACAGFEQINAALYQVGVKAQFYSAATNPCTRFVNGLVYAVAGVASAVMVIHGRISVGQMSCFLSYANQYTKPFNEVTGVLAEMQTALASAKRIFDCLDSPSPCDAPDARRMIHCRGEVTLSNVSFAYTKDRPLIEGLNLQVRPGQHVALVGPTGAGKTTLINLLLRFYEVDGGKIEVDGVDIRMLTRDSLRRQYGMVLQETWLMHATVRENIAYGKPDATLEQVIAAAKAAHAHGFIRRLPNGYDTILAEEGSNLSQGQKQLLCIARVMLVAPPMLLLDEATSNIDTRTEIWVQRAFARMMEGRTSFVVAHRLSTIREADIILVMEQGHIVEQGTHDALLAQAGSYARLYQSQFVREDA